MTPRIHRERVPAGARSGIDRDSSKPTHFLKESQHEHQQR
jgi:hypothetical protein